MRQAVQKLPQPQQAKGGQPAVKPLAAGSAAPDYPASANFRQFDAGGLSLSAPDNWKVGGDKESGRMLVLPEGGLLEDGGIGAGILIGTFQPKEARGPEEAHQELLKTLIQQNQGKMKAEAQAQNVQIGGHNGLLSRMSSPSPYQGGAKENDVVISVSVQTQLLYFILIGPDSKWSQLQAVYEKVLKSVRINAR